MTGATSSAASWKPDRELPGFVETTLRFPDDYDGPVTATLVRNEPRVESPKGAVLYLHGFIDYFFQAHVAAAFNAARFDFYGLDLRKYGRSLDGAKHPNYCHAVDEYFAEITAAIDVVCSEGHQHVVLYGHSTGGLTASLYAAHGDRRQVISKLILNSPFLDFKESRFRTAPAAVVGAIQPFLKQSDVINRWYGPSLHVDRHGEWRFNLAWKPIGGFDVYFGWILAIANAHKRLRDGLGLTIPVLVLRSDRSLGEPPAWRDELHYADLILDVNDMARLAPKLGSDVTVTVVAHGKHDLTLSVPAVRGDALAAMTRFLL